MIEIPHSENTDAHTQQGCQAAELAPTEAHLVPGGLHPGPGNHRK